MSAGPDSARPASASSDSVSSGSASNDSPRAGRSRRLVLSIVLLFASINAIGLFLIYRKIATPDPDVFGVEFASAKGDVRESRELVVRFGRPVVAESEVVGSPKPENPESKSGSKIVPIDGEVKNEAAPTSEAPLLSLFIENAGGELAESASSLDATVFWRDRRTLVLRPKNRLPRATPFRLHLSERVGVSAGLTFEGEREFRFHTSPLALRGVEQTAYSREFRAALRLRFTDPVDPALLATHLKLLDLEGEELRYVVDSKGPARKIELTTRQPVRSLVLALREPGLDRRPEELGAVELRGRGRRGRVRRERDEHALQICWSC